MILLELFIGFLKVGCFAFGGAYGAIPLIRDVVLSYGWLDDEMLTYMIAVSESTPGPIMVNLATYVGSSQAGILGSLIATLAVVLPSPLCSGCSSRAEAMYDRDHPRYRRLYDYQERLCHSEQLIPAPSLDPDADTWRNILWFQKDKERRHIADPADLSFCSRRDSRIWIIKLNTDHYIAGN